MIFIKHFFFEWWKTSFKQKSSYKTSERKRFRPCVRIGKYIPFISISDTIFRVLFLNSSFYIWLIWLRVESMYTLKYQSLIIIGIKMFLSMHLNWTETHQINMSEVHWWRYQHNKKWKVYEELEFDPRQPNLARDVNLDMFGSLMLNQIRRHINSINIITLDNCFLIRKTSNLQRRLCNQQVFATMFVTP